MEQLSLAGIFRKKWGKRKDVSLLCHVVENEIHQSLGLDAQYPE